MRKIQEKNKLNEKNDFTIQPAIKWFHNIQMNKQGKMLLIFKDQDLNNKRNCERFITLGRHFYTKFLIQLSIHLKITMIFQILKFCERVFILFQEKREIL